MAAKNGTPVYTRPNLGNPEGAEFEVHEPMSTALLAVCPDCGFEFDADHQVTDGHGTVGYECPRCLNAKFIAAREAAIADALVQGVSVQHAKLVQDLRAAERELAHLRPQNELLKREAGPMRAALKEVESYLDRRSGASVDILRSKVKSALGDEAS